MSDIFGFNTRVQFHLTRAEGTPVVGPIFVSPIKAVFSVAQMISSFAIAVILGALAGITRNEWLTQHALSYMVDAHLGFLGLQTSVMNMLSLGTTGYQLAKPLNEISDIVGVLENAFKPAPAARSYTSMPSYSNPSFAAAW